MPRPLLRSLLCCALALAAGCGSEPPGAADPTAPAPARPESPPALNPSQCGTIAGAVTWTGPVPEVPALDHIIPRADGSGYDTRTVVPAHAPRIDRFTRGLAGAVVYLREVDTARAKPWNLGPVGVEFRDAQLVVRQDGRTGRTGFVPRGGTVSMQSAESDFQVLRGRGAAFFAVPFPDPFQPRERAFGTCGRIDLSSAAGFYWQSAELFVCDHPYYAVSDAAGRFKFTDVPAGRYDLVAWHPNWIVARADRNPETGLVNCLHYAPPLESARPVVVSPGENRPTLATLTLPK